MIPGIISYPYRTICITPPLPRFSMVDRHLHGSRDTIIVSVPKRSAAVETCRRELSEDVSFGMGTGTLVVYRHKGVML